MATSNSAAVRHKAPPTLFHTCIRFVSKYLVLYRNDDSLKYLPAPFKCLIIRYVTKVYKGFQDEQRLLGVLLNSQLQRIDLTTSIVGDETLLNLQKCPNLVSLALYGLHPSDSLGVDSLRALLRRLPKLRQLQLKDSSLVTDDVVRTIGESCPQLDHLDLERCAAITDAALLSIREMRLTKLNLAHTPLTDAGLRHLAGSSCENFLEDLNVKYCRISCNGLSHLRWDKIKYIGFEVQDFESKDTAPEPHQAGRNICWFRRDIVLA